MKILTAKDKQMESELGTGALHNGGALSVLRTLGDESVQTIITSPPYWGLRDYGVEGQIGAEPTLPEYIAALVEVFEEATPCSCGGVLHVQNSATGETYSHSEPFTSWKEHVALIHGKGAVRIE